MDSIDPLGAFSAPVRTWFDKTFAGPTGAQTEGWPAIASGEHTLILAPTGSGKTLAAFLWGLDRLMTGPRIEDRERRTRLLYISPLRALAVDVEKNLRVPLEGVSAVGEQMGEAVSRPTVAMRTGDTPADERRKLVRNPPDLLITTPESLYLMLTSKARETLAGVETVIIDEIHALAATKRGSHLALTLERLVEQSDAPPQRVGLSATQRPLDEIARFLGGRDEQGPRPVTIVDAGVSKELDIEVVIPVEDMGRLGEVVHPPEDGPAATRPVQRSIWPALHPRLLDLVLEHRSTLIYVNARRMAERLATTLNELHTDRLTAGEGLSSAGVSAPDGKGEVAGRASARSGEAGDPDGEAATAEQEPVSQHGGKGEVAGRDSARSGEQCDPDGEAGTPEAAQSHRAGTSEASQGHIVKAHHGSLSRERRLQIEDELKSGRLRGLVATSSLELGIDMGAVDLVIQVESPGSVSRGLQRIGRAGHQVGEPSRGRLFPKHRSDLLEAAVVVQRMQAGLIESTRFVRNPLDVLAQQIVAMCALDDWPIDDLRRVVRRAAPFEGLSDEMFDNVLDLLAGRYPSEEFSELRPRVVWDRVAGVVRGRAGSQRLAVTSGGTIPDRGLYGVFLPDGTRVGELDEEMVYESRPGETFLLGASTWRIEEVTAERVVVTPAPGQPGKMPFWHGDGPGRPLELGRAMGEFVRRTRSAGAEAMESLQAVNGLDEWAAANLIGYLDEQAEATGAVPDDRTIVVERFRDEIGDWRVCVLSPFGAQVHAPWAMALQHRLGEQWGLDVELMWSDDGIVLRLPEAVDDLPVRELMVDPDEIDELITRQLPGTALFSARFRECAARSLLLPRRRPDQRTPLWQQRQRAADLLTVAARHPTFPVLLEATRECVNDVFDVPALRQVLGDLRSGAVQLVPVETNKASPFAQSLLFGWIAVYMYESDAPLAERRATALALDRDLLRDLLGAEELRELLDAGVLAELELELQRLTDGRKARDPDEAADLLRVLGPLSREEVEARSGGPGSAWLDTLLAERRVIPVPVAGAERFAAVEDAARVRDALGVTVPDALPAELTEPVATPLVDLVARFAHTNGPFLTEQVSRRLGISVEAARDALESLEADGRVVRGEFRPEGHSREWCDDDVLRQLRRRSLAALRREVAPVDQTALGRFLPGWQGVGLDRRGPDALADVLGVLQGAPLPASVIEADVLPARMADYQPADLDALCTAGEVVWVGAGSLGAGDGRVRLLFRDQVGLLAPVAAEPPDDPTALAILDHLRTGGASFWPDLVGAAAQAGAPYEEEVVLAALWDVVWAGLVTNDSLAPVRALGQGRRRAGSGAGARRRPRPDRLTRLGPPSAAGRWSLVEPLRGGRPSDTAVAAARAAQLLARYGVLTREAALGEGAEGGFAGVYPVLKELEERGQARRGYFVEGLGGAQFALPGAVDRLRSVAGSAGGGRATTPNRAVGPVVLAATDPAQPYGASLPWPTTEGRPGRVAGAHVVLFDGEPAVYLERGGRSLVTFPVADRTEWAPALRALVDRGRLRSIEVGKVDGAPITGHPTESSLRDAGFTEGYRGWTYRG